VASLPAMGRPVAGPPAHLVRRGAPGGRGPPSFSVCGARSRLDVPLERYSAGAAQQQLLPARQEPRCAASSSACLQQKVLPPASDIQLYQQ